MISILGTSEKYEFYLESTIEIVWGASHGQPIFTTFMSLARVPYPMGKPELAN